MKITKSSRDHDKMATAKYPRIMAPPSTNLLLPRGTQTCSMELWRKVLARTPQV